MSLLKILKRFIITQRPLISDRVRPFFNDPEHRKLITQKIIELRSSTYKERFIKYNYKGNIYEIMPVLDLSD